MRPAEVYHPDSRPYMDGWAALGADRVVMLDITKPLESYPLDDISAAYMRIGHGLKWRVALDALRVQWTLKSKGVRIVNRLENKLVSDRKDIYYPLLAAAGFRVPAGIPMPENNEIRFAVEVGALAYPFVLRVPDGMQGQKTRLVSGNEEMESCLKDYAAAKDRVCACEFIPKKPGAEYYSKWRPYIFGGKVDLWECTLSRRWKATVANNLDFEPADFVEANALTHWPLRWDKEMVEAARVLGLDVCALDVIETPDGKPCIVDVNATYGYQCDKIEAEKGIRLFDDKVRGIRDGHFGRFADWMGGSK
jgi:glutathione synthase/RimK-type ligase-like ATP-grasp enzyme